jgi:TPP-dependent pyruvate/acetoin dehydrogenase alpha subunit
MMYSKTKICEMYKVMYTIRIFEQRCIQLYRQGFIRGYFHPYLGEEAIAAGVCAALTDRDFIVSTHRGHGHCIARGARLDYMTAELLGKKAGFCLGLGGSMHIADVDTGNLGANGIVGGGIPIGIGAAMAISIRGEERVVAIFFSDGAANNGVFAESLNLAAIWNLPAVFVLENNHYAVSTPIEQSSRVPDLYKRGLGYGIDSSAVDGNDVVKVYDKTSEAVKKCRRGEGPVLIEAKTYRHGGHHVNDPGLYMPAERMEYFKSRDPLSIAREHILKLGTIKQEQIEVWEKEIDEHMELAIEFAKQCPDMPIQEFLHMVEDYS